MFLHSASAYAPAGVARKISSISMRLREHVKYVSEGTFSSPSTISLVTFGHRLFKRRSPHVMDDGNTKIKSLSEISRGHGTTTYFHVVCSAGQEQSPDARVVAEASIL